MVDRRKIMEVNDALQERIDNGETEVSLVTVEPMLQGITKASSALTASCLLHPSRRPQRR